MYVRKDSGNRKIAFGVKKNDLNGVLYSFNANLCLNAVVLINIVLESVWGKRKSSFLAISLFKTDKFKDILGFSLELFPE